MVASAVLVLATLAGTGWTLVVLSHLSRDTGVMVRDSADTTAATTAVTTALEREDDALLLRLGSPRGADPLTDARARTDAARRALRAVLVTPDERRGGDAIDDAVRAYREAADRVADAPGDEPFARYHREANPRLRAAVASVATVRDEHFAEAAAVASVARREVARTQRAVAVIAAVVLALAMALATRLAGFVTQPLRRLAMAAAALREGNFEARVEVAHGDELGQVAGAFNDMAQRLAEFRRLDLDAVLRVKATLEATMAALPDAVLLLDPDGTVASHNAAAEALFAGAGVPLPRTVDDLTALGVDRARLDEARATQQPGVDLRAAWSVLVADEPRRLLPRVAPTVPDRDGRSGAVLVLSDVSELARLDEMRAELVAVASHELQTPVTTLRMSLMMLREARDRLDARARALVDNALGGVEQLGETVDEFLDLARLESGALRLTPEPVDVGALVADRVARCADRAAELAVTVTVTADPDAPRALADRARLRVVVDNVLGNALKYTPAGGSIALTVGPVEGARRAVRLTVDDTGPGVPPEFRARVFEKFFRVEHHRRASGDGPRGTGIGLYLCRQIVDLHGGELACVAPPDGRGTRIAIELPAAADA